MEGATERKQVWRVKGREKEMKAVWEGWRDRGRDRETKRRERERLYRAQSECLMVT